MSLCTSVCAGLLLAGHPAVPEASAAGFSTGFTDTLAFERESPIRQLTLPRAAAAKATYVRTFAFWESIAPRQPQGAEAADPAWSGYRWSMLDAKLRDVAASGLTPIVVIDRAPAWAEAPGRPPVSTFVPAGTWRPSPEALAQFASAITVRYSGSFPDPLNPGAPLPRVKAWQVWNEPNLYNDLTPQWESRRGALVTASPGHYRSMLRAAYPAIKATAADNLVITAGLGPFGDFGRGSNRIPPALFMREFVCVSGRKRPVARRCSGGPATFDILAHHPYPIGSPETPAPNPDDVVVADYGRLKRPLAVAQRAGNVAPRGAKRLWATELSWDSAPDPDGLSLSTQARYLTGAFNVLWRQGVDTVIWFNLRDQPKGEDWGSSLQSGIYRSADDPRNDVAKPSFTAFRFPFTAQLPRRGANARLWGLAPSRGPVVIEKRSGARWRRARVVRANSSRVFEGRLATARGTTLRARQGGELSLPWRVAR